MEEGVGEEIIAILMVEGIMEEGIAEGGMAVEMEEMGEEEIETMCLK